ncbi:MAG: sensor histidine kinase [Acidobacteriota bacterium]|nr:sensor histidine kinase [Acidobacteriota bacterium]
MDDNPEPGAVFNDSARREGLELARLGVPLECAVTAIGLYLDARLCCTEGAHLKRARALLGWASDYQFHLLGGYNEHLDAERRVFEQQIEDADGRSRERVAELRELYEKERRRLAQDLHDEVGHDLIVLKLYVELIARDLGDGDVGKLRRKLTESVSLIQHALKGVRHLTFALGPAIWNEEGFVSAVRLYVRQFSARTELKVRFSAKQLKTVLSSDYEAALYKALQGSLANIAAHSGAKEVNITLSSNARCVVMTVADDGKGFNVERKLKLPQQSFGLRAMGERIEGLGGTIQFHSGTTKIGSGAGIGSGGAGTIVEFRLPLEAIDNQ